MRWPPVTLTVGILVLVDRIGNAAQLAGRGLAAPHARDDAVGAILLDVGVAALVDGAALRVVLGLLGPGADQVVVDGRAAGGAAVGRLPFHEGGSTSSSGQQVVLGGWPRAPPGGRGSVQPRTALVLGVAA